MRASTCKPCIRLALHRKAEGWTLDAFLKAAQACHKAGFPFGIGLGTTTDSVDSAGAIFDAFGAQLVDAKGKVTVKTDAVRQALDYYTQLARFFPPDAPAWDDASNNKFLIAGKGSLILNPPSAWAVAKRDAPQGRRAAMDVTACRPGRKVASHLASHISGASGRSARTSRRPRACSRTSRTPAAIEKMVAASQGFDIPAFAKLTALKTWAEEGPPKGTLYHYPNRYDHQIVSIAGAPAPPKIAVQIYVQGIMTKMTVRHMQGEPMEKTLAWAESEVEGFLRT